LFYLDLIYCQSIVYNGNAAMNASMLPAVAGYQLPVSRAEQLKAQTRTSARQQVS